MRGKALPELHLCVLMLQFTETKQLARESAARLNGFMDELRAGGKVRQCWVPPLHAVACLT